MSRATRAGRSSSPRLVPVDTSYVSLHTRRREYLDQQQARRDDILAQHKSRLSREQATWSSVSLASVPRYRWGTQLPQHATPPDVPCPLVFAQDPVHSFAHQLLTTDGEAAVSTTPAIAPSHVDASDTVLPTRSASTTPCSSIGAVRQRQREYLEQLRCRRESAARHRLLRSRSMQHAFWQTQSLATVPRLSTHHDPG